MASEFKIKNGLIVVGDVSTSGTITINGALAATQSWVTSQAYLTSSSLTSYATQSYVTSAIASLVDSAPGALDTLRELATALGNDASFATTITNSIASKLSLSGGTMTGQILFQTSALNNGFRWDVNSDAAGITFKNTGDGDNNSYFNFFTEDNGNEYFKFSHNTWNIGSFDFMDVKNGVIRTNGDIYVNASQSGSRSAGTNELINGSRVWHSGDFSSTNVSNWNTAYSWGNHSSAGYQSASTAITTSNIGSQSVSYATSSGTATDGLRLLREDNRTISPSELTAGYLKFGFTSWTNDNGGPYADFLHLRSYTDASGGDDNLVMFKKSGIGMRIWQQTWGSTTPYSSYADVWTTVNFTQTNVNNWNTSYGWGNHASQSYATTSYVTTQINNLVNGAPGALDTLSELATALGNDASFATTVTNSIAGKVSKSGDTITGNLNVVGNIYSTTSLGVILNAADSPLITRGWDSFTSGAYNGIGRWGLFMEPSTLVLGTPNIAGNGQVAFRRFNADGTSTTTLMVNSVGTTIYGNLTVSGTITENSSIKLKENVETSEGNLEKVVNLRPVSYNKIGSETKELGLIAEEVAQVYPEFVQYDENGEPVGVHYSRLTAALIGAVKQLTKRIETLENNG